MASTTDCGFAIANTETQAFTNSNPTIIAITNGSKLGNPNLEDR